MAAADPSGANQAEIAAVGFRRAAAACTHKSASAATMLQITHVKSAPMRHRRLAARKRARSIGNRVARLADAILVSDRAATGTIGYFVALALGFGASEFSTINRSMVPSARSESIAWPSVTERKDSFDRRPMPSSVGCNSNGAGIT